ncbi:hypothetical protein ACW2Q0_06550 [Nocardia sp. R16R-3T]
MSATTIQPVVLDVTVDRAADIAAIEQIIADLETAYITNDAEIAADRDHAADRVDPFPAGRHIDEIPVPLPWPLRPPLPLLGHRGIQTEALPAHGAL